MKILILSPYCPVPHNSGGRIRIWEEIRFLTLRHEITLISFYQTEEEYDHREMLAKVCDEAILVKRPDSLQDADLQHMRQLSDIFQWYSTPEMNQALDIVSGKQFDVVIFEHIFMAQYGTLFSTIKILQEHNIESNIFKQLAHLYSHPNPTPAQQKENAFRRSRWMLMRKYENETWPKFPLRITVSQQDKAELDSRCPTGRTAVIENGINTREIRLIPEDRWLDNSPRNILFMGALDFYPNIDSLFYLKERILPILWQTDPTITVVLAGRNPSEVILDFAADPRIDVIANPREIEEVAKDCYLTVVPLRIGSGTRIKILHSMALGLPVIATTLGCEGLNVVNGRNIFIRDTPEQFAEAILTLVADSRLAMGLRTEGRKLVEEQYDWSLIFERLEDEMLALVDSAA
jgi:glycosyltransferase involved in cell wall biosynthesis